MLLLKQSTAVTVKIGPFLDEDDGKTQETGLTLTQADIRLSKNGGDFAQKNESSASSHDEKAWYDCDLDATDTNTVGRLQLAVHESGALPVFMDFHVLSAKAYDNYTGGANQSVVDSFVEGTVSSTYFTPSRTEFETTDVTETTDDHYNGRRIIWRTGALAHSETVIGDYTWDSTNSASHFTVTQMVEAPSSGDVFVII